MSNPITRWTIFLATGLERFLAFAILAGIVIYAYISAIEMLAMDWTSLETFYDFIYRVLALVIAVELIRTLVTHNLTAILELIAFVVARKMLKPDISSMDILLCSLAFVSLLVVYKYLLPCSAPDANE